MLATQSKSFAWAVVATCSLVAGGASVARGDVTPRVACSADDPATWDEASRRRDPEGYLGAMESRVVAELDDLRTSREALRDKTAQLGEVWRTRVAEGRQARELADELRRAGRGGTYPVSWRDRQFPDEDAVLTQLHSLLSEGEQADRDCANLLATKHEADRRLAELLARISALEAYRATLAVKRELIRVGRLRLDAIERDPTLARLMERYARPITAGGPRSAEELRDSWRSGGRCEPKPVVDHLTESRKLLQQQDDGSRGKPAEARDGGPSWPFKSVQSQY